MAKSKSFFGLRSGSTKSQTFAVLDGQQITKDRVTNVANPRTASQATQRMKMAAVINFFRGLAMILDHSFEGIKYGNKSRQYFMKLALASPNAIAGVDKNEKQFVPLNLPVSTGSMQKLQYEYNAGKPRLVLPVALGTIADTTRATIVNAIMTALDMTDGQLTFIIARSGVVTVKRLILDPSAVIQDDFAWIQSHATITAGNAYIEFTSVADGFAVIASELINGKWRRSPQEMLISPAFSNKVYSYIAVEAAKGSYMSAITGGKSDMYLNEGESNPFDDFRSALFVTPQGGTTLNAVAGGTVTIPSASWAGPVEITAKVNAPLETEPVLVAGGAASSMDVLIEGENLIMNFASLSASKTSFTVEYKGVTLITVSKGS